MTQKKKKNQLHLQNSNSTVLYNKVSGFSTVIADNQQLNKSITKAKVG